MASLRKRKWQRAGQTQTAWVVDFHGPDGKRARRQFDTRAEADVFRIKIESAISTGLYRGDAAKSYLRDVGEAFLTHCQQRMQRRERMTRHNYDVYAGHIRNYICADAVSPETPAGSRKRRFDRGLGGVVLRDLTHGRIERFCDDLKLAGVSVPTARKILGTFKQVLRFAVSRDVVAVNVARDVRIIGRRDQTSKKIVPPSKDAMRRLIAVADEDFRVQLVFAAATGVRAGEFHALRWRHFDLHKGEVTIETRVDAHGSEDVTKTQAGMRDIPLGREVVGMLLAWRQRSSFHKPSDLVFPNRKGQYENHDNLVKRRFRPLFEKLAAQHAADPVRHPRAPSYFNWHALRHFAISCWIEARLTPKTIQTFAGHSSLHVTMDRYGHLFKSDDHHAAMDQIAEHLFSV